MPLEPCSIQLPPNSRSSTAFARRCPPGERGTFGSNASVVRPEGSTGNMSDVIEKNGSLHSFTLQKHVFFLHHVVHGITKGYLISYLANRNGGINQRFYLGKLHENRLP